MLRECLYPMAKFYETLNTFVALQTKNKPTALNMAYAEELKGESHPSIGVQKHEP